MKLITLDCNYVQGYLRDGHFELKLTDEKYADFLNLPKEKQIDYIKDCGDLKIDSYRVEDFGTIDYFNISDIKE